MHNCFKALQHHQQVNQQYNTLKTQTQKYDNSKCTVDCSVHWLYRTYNSASKIQDN